MGRSMDWTLEDNMVDGFFSAPHSQATEETIPRLYKQERKRPTLVRRRLRRTQAHLRGSFRECGWWCRGWKCGALWGCPSTTHSIGNPPTASNVCCFCQMNWWGVVQRVQMVVSIWGAVRPHSMNGWVPTGEDAQATWHGVLETLWLHCEEAQQVGCLRVLEGCPLV